jgi:hypothetical protein
VRRRAYARRAAAELVEHTAGTGLPGGFDPIVIGCIHRDVRPHFRF